MTVPIDAWARDHLASWELQQAAYVSRREDRFDVMLDVLEQVVPSDALVVDLACGPGSIAARVLARFPEMTCLALDVDPVLLELGRRALGDQDGRLRFAEADLWDPQWTAVLTGVRPHAMLSSTALHWLPAHVLCRVYADTARVLEPGGILLNADHLRQPDHRPLFEELCRRDDMATQQRDQARGALTWDAWWDELVAHPTLAPLAVERQRRFANRPPNPELSLANHVATLRATGYREAGAIWQHLDDYVVLAQR